MPRVVSSPRAWRRFLLGLCALGFGLTVNAVWTGAYALGVDPGVTRAYTTPLVVPKVTGQAPFVIRIEAPPESPAFRQGLRTGDLLDLRLLTPGERYRWLNYFRVAGERADIPIVRDGKRLVVNVVSESRTLAGGGLLSYGWDSWLALFGLFWTLIFAAIIAWKRSDSTEGRILSLLLSTLVPAIVSLKASRKSVDLHAIQTQLQGEFAYPMVARGHLVGAIVLGPKLSGDPYVPDESDAILHLAHGVGGALDALSANGLASRDGLLEAIEAMSGSLSALAAKIDALSPRPT